MVDFMSGTMMAIGLLAACSTRNAPGPGGTWTSIFYPPRSTR
jgi:hypothetical protein